MEVIRCIRQPPPTESLIEALMVFNMPFTVVKAQSVITALRCINPLQSLTAAILSKTANNAAGRQIQINN